jgi:hypothetical protein
MPRFLNLFSGPLFFFVTLVLVVAAIIRHRRGGLSFLGPAFHAGQ